MKSEFYFGAAGAVFGLLGWYAFCAFVAWDLNPEHWVTVWENGRTDTMPRALAALIALFAVPGGCAGAIAIARWNAK